MRIAGCASGQTRGRCFFHRDLEMNLPIYVSQIQIQSIDFTVFQNPIKTRKVTVQKSKFCLNQILYAKIK